MQGAEARTQKSGLTYLTHTKVEFLVIVVTCATDFPTIGAGVESTAWGG